MLSYLSILILTVSSCNYQYPLNLSSHDHSKTTCIKPLPPSSPGGKLDAARRHTRTQENIQVAAPALSQVGQNPTYTTQTMSHHKPYLIYWPNFPWRTVLKFVPTMNPKPQLGFYHSNSPTPFILTYKGILQAPSDPNSNQYIYSIHKIIIKSLNNPAQNASQQKTQTLTRRLADIHPCQAVYATRTQNYTQTDEPPSGSCMPARRFLGRTQKSRKTAHTS